MEEIIAALQQAAQSQASEIQLVDEDDLIAIEEAILLPIPGEFKEFLLQASHLVIGHLEPVTVYDPYLHSHLPEVTAEAWENGLPRDLLPLCPLEGGYYCVDENGQVLLFNEGEIQDETWDSVWQWAEEIWLHS